MTLDNWIILYYYIKYKKNTLKTLSIKSSAHLISSYITSKSSSVPHKLIHMSVLHFLAALKRNMQLCA